MKSQYRCVVKLIDPKEKREEKEEEDYLCGSWFKSKRKCFKDFKHVSKVGINVPEMCDIRAYLIKRTRIWD